MAMQYKNAIWTFNIAMDIGKAVRRILKEVHKETVELEKTKEKKSFFKKKIPMPVEEIKNEV